MGGSMSVSTGYRTYIVDQLAALAALSTRRMFGGLGLYSGESFFALIDDDVLFFKVDDVNREDYVSRGMQAFMPFPGQPSLGYFQVPAEVIEEAEELTRWARRSVEVAQRAALRKPQKRKTPARKQ
jgi:DNA transformation protein and related proteins